MKKNTLKALSFALCTSMVVSNVTPVMAQTSDPVNVMEDALLDTEQNMKETYGSLSYSISGTTLTISGTGPMQDAASPSQVAWYSSREEITKVVVSAGVTTIGDYAFYNFENLESRDSGSSTFVIIKVIQSGAAGIASIMSGMSSASNPNSEAACCIISWKSDFAFSEPETNSLSLS